MSSRIVSDPGRVWAYLHSLGVMRSVVSGMQGIGLERDGELVAGVIYEGFNGHNVWMHVGADPSKRWMTKEYLRYCFHYPFNELGVRRVSGYVESSNADAVRFDEHLGFKPEARLAGAAKDGSDVILYVMWRGDCRYVDSK